MTVKDPALLEPVKEACIRVSERASLFEEELEQVGPLVSCIAFDGLCVGQLYPGVQVLICYGGEGRILLYVMRCGSRAFTTLYFGACRYQVDSSLNVTTESMARAAERY